MNKLVASLALLLVLQSLPARSRASSEPPTAEHRIGVIMMVICGVSARTAPAAPVPMIGIAVASCIAGCLDALLDPD